MSQETAFQIPTPINEPIRTYVPGSDETLRLQARLKSMAGEKVEIPLFIDGKEVRTGNTRKVVMPHEHGTVLAEFHLAGPKEMQDAADAAARAKAKWEAMPWQDRAGIFLKAADLLEGPYRDLLNGSTMLSQSKNVYQAEIDAACELIDFFKFNAKFYQEILEGQPISSPGMWNRLEYRPLEGFIFAITPFNFTSIAANLAAAPAMLGNTVVWKPSDTQMLSAYYTMKLFQEAGVPDGVINMIGADGPESGKTLLPRRDLGGVHFTGSTATFQTIWRSVGENISQYQSYPRIVGETGGKDFIFAHPSADCEALAVAMLRGAFEYQGQKCSAASRVYVPKSIWPKVKERLISDMQTLKMGDVRDFSHFINAVIDQRSFEKIKGYIDYGKSSSDATLLQGGECDDRVGYFIQPTLFETSDPHFKTMEEEIFGPVLTVYPYEDSQFEEVLKVCDQTSPYALTGAIFAQDRYALEQMKSALRHSAGNFYINDKPTAAVVGQQPFGGARASGTNDKAGSPLNLLRFLSPRTMKETFHPPTDYRYPFLGD